MESQKLENPRIIEWADELKVAIALVQVLDQSLDWYLLFKVVDNQIEVIYRNKPVRDKIATRKECVITSHCFEFSDLQKEILEVYETKIEKNIPYYVLSCSCIPETIYFNVQIYRNNGHVVLCARDLTKMLTENVKELTKASKRLDGLLHKDNTKCQSVNSKSLKMNS